MSQQNLSDQVVPIRNRTNSLLGTHLALISGERGSFEGEASEVDRFNHLTWPDLDVRERRVRRFFVPAALLAASLAFVIFKGTSNESMFAPKGPSKVFVVVERSGKTSLMEPNDVLNAGEHVNAEIVAKEHVIAFMGAYDRSGIALFSRQQMEENALEIESGRKGYFKSAIELTAENDGENLFVIHCSFDKWSKRYQHRADFVEKFAKKLPSAEIEGDMCSSVRVMLRK